MLYICLFVLFFLVVFITGMLSLSLSPSGIRPASRTTYLLGLFGQILRLSDFRCPLGIYRLPNTTRTKTKYKRKKK